MIRKKFKEQVECKDAIEAVEVMYGFTFAFLTSPPLFGVSVIFLGWSLQVSAETDRRQVDSGEDDSPKLHVFHTPDQVRATNSGNDASTRVKPEVGGVRVFPAFRV